MRCRSSRSIDTRFDSGSIGDVPRMGERGALAVGYGLFFLLTARSISVEVDAETAPTIDVRGLHLQFGGRLLMRPGHYPLSVTAEGYQDYDGDLHVDGTEVQTRAVQSPPCLASSLLSQIRLKPASALMAFL